MTEIIESDPNSEQAKEAFHWWYRIGRAGLHPYDAILSTELALKVFEKSERLEEFTSRIYRHFPSDLAEKRLKQVIEVSPFEAVKASATYSLLKTLEKRIDNQEDAPANIVAEIESLKTLLKTKYVDAAMISGAKYSGLIEAEEFAKKLEIGQPVPNIVGNDIDGEKFELADYKDKVVVISFWGFW